MKRTTYVLLRIIFHYSQLLGVVNFHYDRETGEARKNVYITVYSFCITVAMFGVIPYFALTLEIKTRPPGAADIHYKLNLILTQIRIGGVLITLVLNWIKRDNFIKLINKLQNFIKTFLQKWLVAEKFEKYLDNGIQKKYSRSLMADFAMFMGSLQVFRDILDVENPMILLALALIPTVLNIIMENYYFAILNVNILVILINDEIKRILKSRATLYAQQRSKCINSRNLTMRCSQLADELEDLSADLLKLQKFVKCLSQMYDIQGVCCIFALYINNISVIYILCMLSRHQEIWAAHVGSWAIYLLPVGLCVFYSDLYLFFRVMIDYQELVEHAAQLLQDNQFWYPNLNETLEKSVSVNAK